MKSAGKVKPLIVRIALMLFLAIGLAGLQGMVLCYESDGGISLENAIVGICSDSFQEVRPLQTVSLSHRSDILQEAPSRRCVDVPLSIIGGKHQEQKISGFLQGSVDSPMLAEAVNAGYPATITQQQYPQPPPLRPALHRLLSTVVLLI